MNVSGINNNVSQLLNIISNPLFLNAVKSVVKTGGEGNKYSPLLENLEKLSSILSQANGEQETSALSVSSDSSVPNVSSTSSSGNVNLEGLSDEDKLTFANILNAQSLDSIIDSIISRADFLESILDFDIIPSEEALIELFQKLRSIISKLDSETRKNHKEAEDKKSQSQYKLLPNSNTKSGFNESLLLVAK